MRIGTKSLLFGEHQFVLHPVFVLWGWVRLYGRPSWRELVAIVVHDWGYWGSPNMDGPEGEEHAVRSARIAIGLAGEQAAMQVMYHSRFVCRRVQAAPSRLCYADKWASAYMPTWLWVLLGRLSGELDEYVCHPKYDQDVPGYDSPCPYAWHRRYRTFASRFLLSASTAS